MIRRLASALVPVGAASVLAGIVLGVVEIGHVVAVRGLNVADVGAGGVAGLFAAAIALSIAVALVAVPAMWAALRALAAMPGLGAWYRQLRNPGGSRVVALYRGVVASAAAGLFAGIAMSLSMWTQARFHAPGAIALLQSAVLTASAAALVVAAAAALRSVPGPLARSDALARWTRGGRGALSMVVASGAVAAAGWAFLRLAAPDADFRQPVTLVVFVAVSVALLAVGVGHRVGRRVASGITAAGAAAAIAGIASLGGLDYARGAMAADGATTRAALAALWRVGIAGGGADLPAAGELADPDTAAHRFEGQPTAYPEVKGEMSAILLTVDALRTDHLSVYGYERPTTPHLEDLASRGTRFEWAITPSPTTRRAVPAIMTSRYSSTMTWQDMRWVRVEIGEHELISETFQHAGYDTAAIHCCTTLFDKPHGMAEGFDFIDASADKVGRERRYNADAVAENIVSYLEGRRGQETPFFIWSHILDPHNPYLQVPGAPDFGNSDSDRYDSQIAFVDAQIGAIIEALDEAGLADETLIAVTSDHGQEFGEHGGRFHGRHLYNEVMRVPLIVYDPIAASELTPNVVIEPVSAIDVGPTLLDLAGVDRPAGKNGLSLAAAVRGGEPPPDRMILGELIADYSISRNLLAGWDYPWKIVWDQDANTYELFSLEDDPLDARNLRHRETELFRELRDELHEAAARELTDIPR